MYKTEQYNVWIYFLAWIVNYDGREQEYGNLNCSEPLFPFCQILMKFMIERLGGNAFNFFT